MAAVVEVDIRIAAPVESVWRELADLGSHQEWMTDADSIAFTGDQRSGVGTRMSVATSFGPLRTSDEMVFTEWDPPQRMSVEHEGLFTGRGSFSLRPDGEGTMLQWREEITFPLRFGGRLGELAARPIFRHVWRRNLERLRDRVTRP